MSVHLILASLCLTHSLCSYKGVYYKTFVYEKVENDWRHRFTESMWQDFILYDPRTPQTQILVPTHRTKIIVRGLNDGQATSGAGAVSFFQSETLPEGIAALLERHNFQVEVNVLFGKMKKEMKYVEECFKVGEQIACLGVVKDGIDPAQGGRPIKTLLPMHANALTDLFFDQHNWSGTERSIWNELLGTGSALLASDDPAVFQVHFPSLRSLSSPLTLTFSREWSLKISRLLPSNMFLNSSHSISSSSHRLSSNSWLLNSNRSRCNSNSNILPLLSSNPSQYHNKWSNLSTLSNRSLTCLSLNPPPHRSSLRLKSTLNQTTILPSNNNNNFHCSTSNSHRHNTRLNLNTKSTKRRSILSSQPCNK
jgi:hypothetical protein